MKKAIIALVICIAISGIAADQMMVINPDGKCSASVDFTGTVKISGSTIGTAATTAATAYAPAAGSTNITTLGTIATGSWNATAIPLNKGGTGAATASAGLTALGTARGTSGAMTSGVVVVKNAAITGNSIIVLTPVIQSGALPMGSLAVDSKTAGWGFEVVSSSASDTATVNWHSMEP